MYTIVSPILNRSPRVVLYVVLHVVCNTNVGLHAKLSVKAGFAELRDENLPFEKSVFASAVKKSLENAIEKLQ